MHNPWDNFLTRLKNVAHNKGQNSGATMLCVTLFVVDGDLVGWFKPERKPLEPKNFPIEFILPEKK